MRTRLAVALVVTSIGAAVAAGPVAADPATPGGCPQGYVAFDRQTGDGVPPSYRQGEQVVASGALIDTAAGVPHVTLRSASPDGPELGRATVAADGSWQGLAFEIPREVRDGTYLVYLEARDRNGTMLSGLPYPFQITVGPPPAPRQTAPAPQAGSDKPSLATRTAEIDAMAERVRPALRGARSAPPRASAERPVAARREPATSAEPVTRAVPQAARRAPGSAAPQSDPVRSLRPSAGFRPEAEAPAAVPEPAAVDMRPREVPASSSRGLPDMPTPLLLALLAAAGLAGALAARRRHRPPDEQPTVAAPAPVPPDCPVEAELQALLEGDLEAPAFDEDQEPALL